MAAIHNTNEPEINKIIRGIYSFRDVVEFFDLIHLKFANFKTEGSIPKREELGNADGNEYHRKVRLYDIGIITITGKASTLSYDGLFVADSYGESAREAIIDKMKRLGACYFKAKLEVIENMTRNSYKMERLGNDKFAAYTWASLPADWTLNLTYETKGTIMDEFGRDNRVLIDLNKHKK